MKKSLIVVCFINSITSLIGAERKGLAAILQTNLGTAQLITRQPDYLLTKTLLLSLVDQPLSTLETTHKVLNERIDFRKQQLASLVETIKKLTIFMRKKLPEKKSSDQAQEAVQQRKIRLAKIQQGMDEEVINGQHAFLQELLRCCPKKQAIITIQSYMPQIVAPLAEFFHSYLVKKDHEEALLFKNLFITKRNFFLTIVQKNNPSSALTELLKKIQNFEDKYFNDITRLQQFNLSLAMGCNKTEIRFDESFKLSELSGEVVDRLISLHDQAIEEYTTLNSLLERLRQVPLQEESEEISKTTIIIIYATIIHDLFSSLRKNIVRLIGPLIQERNRYSEIIEEVNVYGSWSEV